MSVLFQTFGTSKEKEEDGIYIPMGINTDGTEIKFKIVRSGPTNKEYQKLLNKLTTPYESMIRTDTLPKEVELEIYMELFLKTILKGWENVYDVNNVAYEYNYMNAKKLMLDLPELYSELVRKSNTIKLFLLDDMKDNLKN